MTRDYNSFMTSDLLMQFRGDNCINNSILISAISRQFNDLLEAFNQLEDKTYLIKIDEDEIDDSISNSEGARNIRLDRIGEIVDLTRKQATFVSSNIDTVDRIDSSEKFKEKNLIDFIKNGGFSTFYQNDVLSDSEYSNYLYYKIFLNSSYCTYSDVIKSLRQFWREAEIYYNEKPEEPATIYLSTPTLRPEQKARLFFLAPIVKAAGVKIYREAVTEDYERTQDIHVGSGMFSGVIESRLPYLIIDHEYKSDMSVESRLENVMSNILSSFGNFVSYEVNGNVYIAISKEDYSRYSSLIYPAMYDGKIVKGVVSPCYGEINSLCGDCTVESIKLPNSIEVLGGFQRFRKLKSVMVPVSVCKLLESAFLGCNSLKTAVIPFECDISEIPARCFECCVSLEEITIPKSVKKIKSNAFYNCNSLSRVIFGGTEEQWQTIEIGNGNSCLSSAEIEFLGGTI